jgi:hypothetical protein
MGFGGVFLFAQEPGGRKVEKDGVETKEGSVLV